MKSLAGTLAAPWPWFGGKSLACSTVWAALGNVECFVEPFCGSAAMLLGRPSAGGVETINDLDGMVANFWRAVVHDAEAVAEHADWPCNEADLFARHSWLVRRRSSLLDGLHSDPDWYDAKVAGWWCWGACNWIGSGWCSGNGPWVHDGETIVLGNTGQGINRQLPHMGDAGQGINRQLPHMGDAGQGINRQLPHGSRSAYIHEWFAALQARMRNVRVACGDWTRVTTDAVTTRHGLTGVFLDPPYTNGEMDYSAGGGGGALAAEVRQWCLDNGRNEALRIVLCGHRGEHDVLLGAGWHLRSWTARKGYAVSADAISNSASETLWCSPHCVPEVEVQQSLFYDSISPGPVSAFGSTSCR